MKNAKDAKGQGRKEMPFFFASLRLCVFAFKFFPGQMVATPFGFVPRGIKRKGAKTQRRKEEIQMQGG